MTVPDYQSLMRPVLQVLERTGAQPYRELVELVADEVSLSEEDRTATVPSGEAMVRNRVGWALSYLSRSGAVVRPKRGISEITDRGRTLLAECPGRITNKELSRYPEFREYKSPTRASQSGLSGGDVSPSDESPRELAERAAEEATAATKALLLQRIQSEAPAFLERLVLKLLLAMGYGDRVDGTSEHTGKSGDEGIDGVIRQDPLGLDLVYLQAKRYGPRVTVGRPEVQAFVGALHGAQASRGVFITTSSFTSGAKEYADHVNARVILIDGHHLASLMIRFGIGVQAEYVATLHRIDEDFFDTL
jgi:restriction system protein